MKNNSGLQSPLPAGTEESGGAVTAFLGAHPQRHLGPAPQDLQRVLEPLGFATLEAWVDAVVPQCIRLTRPLCLPPARSEADVLEGLRELGRQNQVFRSFIGQGYADCVTPAVLQRNLLENPGWYTQYTPYQAEISQGRLEALLNFQTLIVDLTGLEIANASLLDEAMAAAEAMTFCLNVTGKSGHPVLLVSETCHPQTLEVLQTRAQPQGIQLRVGDHRRWTVDSSVVAVLIQYPASEGTIHDYRACVEQAHAAGALVIVASDLLALTLLEPPGAWGADVVVGTSQRFGLPLGFGGPHAAFFATRLAFRRQMPGRLVGVSHDSDGRPAYRLALQTREQHIRREKATSNICTAQVLPAIAAAMYAVYHGPDGLRQIAQRIHDLTLLLAAGLRRLGFETGSEPVFDTLRIHLGGRGSADLVKIAHANRINLRVWDAHTLGVSLDETTTLPEVEVLWQVFNGGQAPDFTAADLTVARPALFPPPLARTRPFLGDPVFHQYHSETELLRYLHRLESKDLSLTTAMIPLGSCTMKLNAAATMQAWTWPEFSRLHPFAPADQARGYHRLFADLETWLAEITGMSAICLQPNAGAAGEYAGLRVVRAYQEHQGQGHRRICLIPQSAHGTNPASAAMAGLTVVPVACDGQGNIDLADLARQAEAHQAGLAAMMVTYPSTHGVFEENFPEIVRIVHAHGGQVFLDGANLNALVGLCRPGDVGVDVCQMNLHKTFGLPHGGGGPGVGPIGVAAHLAPFLPRHPVGFPEGPRLLGPVAAAPWGNASLLTIAWAYLSLLGPEGLTQSTRVALFNANYIAKRLGAYFPVYYQGKNGWVAHECILDFRRAKAVGIEVEDVAKRLMDYGFHAPTLSWPVHDTLMVEPTESESLGELDRFCDALIAIHGEIQAVATGQADPRDNVLKNAPHPVAAVAADRWTHPYSREQAAYPAPWTRSAKFWPAVGRIDNVYGDRHLICIRGQG